MARIFLSGTEIIYVTPFSASLLVDSQTHFSYIRAWSGATKRNRTLVIPIPLVIVVVCIFLQRWRARLIPFSGRPGFVGWDIAGGVSPSTSHDRVADFA